MNSLIREYIKEAKEALHIATHDCSCQVPPKIIVYGVWLFAVVIFLPIFLAMWFFKQ